MVRFSQNICETAVTDQRQLQSAAEETQLQPHGEAQEVESASPLWSPLTPITISLPSSSPPFPVALSIPSPTPSSTSTSLPSASCSTQVATKKGRKRGSSVSTSEVDRKIIEAIELFKNKCSSTQTTQQIQHQQTANPAVQAFSTLMTSIFNKMDEEEQARVVEKMLQVAFEVQRE
ncbi:PREDICTED: uncharacterized protein LOC108974646 [Bactrocera latifrons]|uniref:Uncharacterized protein n=1 Tax=Bactrocera latifrons TaxID=174628 RepID=A0A0K8UE51_BACLA|nr:PREDICTED: uncharacterized protein LOC108974646 [Bactrocera latifrons]